MTASGREVRARTGLLGGLLRGRHRRAALHMALLGLIGVTGACRDEASRGSEARDPPAPSRSERVAEPGVPLGGAEGTVAFNSTSEGGIVLMDPASGASRLLSTGFSAEWSHDGTRLSFVRDARIFVIDADGSGEREIRLEPFHFEPPYVVRPVLSPDGARIAYSRQGDIELSGLDPPSPAFLMTPGPEDDRMPAWSPSGRHIALVRDGDVYVVGADGSGLRNVTRDAADNLDPDWSPAGDWIAYSSARTGDSRIWRIRVDGTDRSLLTRDEAADHQEYHPSWSPDGTCVVFERWGGSGLEDADIYVVEVAGGGVRPLVVDSGFDGMPSWGGASAPPERHRPTP